MRQYEDLNQGLKSLNNKYKLTEQQQSKLLMDINRKMEKPLKKQSSFPWRYYFTTAMAVLLLVVITIPILNGSLENKPDLTQGGMSNSPSPPTTESSEEVAYTFNILNNLSFDIYSIHLDVYQNGNLLASPNGMYADGSPINQGDVFDFQFLQYDGLEKGEVKLILSIVVDPPNKGIQENHFASEITMEITGRKEYQLEILGDSLSDVYLHVDSTSKLPKDIPDFVQESHLDSMDWEKKAVKFNRNIIGNENKSGVIGADMPSLNTQKWMWHLWGIENPTSTKLTVVGFHKETETVHPLLTTGWTIDLGGENNGADAHIPSSVKVPMRGEWAILLYTDEELFDIIVLEIEE